MGVDALDLQLWGLENLCQPGKLLGAETVAPHAGVDLAVDPGRALHAPGHGAEHRGVVGAADGADGSGGQQPLQHGDLAAGAQHQNLRRCRQGADGLGLGGFGDGKVGELLLQQERHQRLDAQPVAVALDHGPADRAGHGGLQAAGVLPQGGAIDNVGGHSLAFPSPRWRIR